MYFEVAEFIDSRRYTEDRKCVYRNKGDRWHFLHVDVKFPERLAIRPFLYEFKRQQALEGIQTYPTISDWYRKKHHRELVIDELVNAFLKKLETECLPYDFNKWGKYPEITRSLEASSPCIHEYDKSGQLKISINPNRTSDGKLSEYFRLLSV
jgi:hypothetical protein